MRKTSVRRFIHAILDVLPLLIIPIFAININQKSVEPISIEVQEQISVDFNQLMNFANVNYDNYGVTVERYENSYIINGTSTNSGNINLNVSVISITNNHKYLIKGISTNNNDYSFRLNVYGVYISNETIWVANSNGITNLQLHYNNGFTFNNEIVVPQIFDLTKMYGSGNEPTIQEFNSAFNGVYYPYTESQKMLIDKPTPTTYDDTDIGSQFLYSLYKPINDYFNFNNLFNMNDVWQWIQLNLFQGTAPLPVYMVWNIILYEFFIDLIFLMYSLFMFIIDWSTNMIDKFLYKSRS